MSTQEIRRLAMKKAKVTVCLSLLLLFGSAGLALGGVAYTDPAGGWAYTFTGDGASGGSNPFGGTDDQLSDTDAFDALDGTWGHTNESDSFDSTVAYTDAGGGIRSQNGYLTIADRINNSDTLANSRYSLVHPIANDAAGAGSPTVVDSGVTLSFRTRLSVNASFPTADGAEIRSSGKGMFTINQTKVHSPTSPPNDSAGERFSFSLITAADYPIGVAAANRVAGLAMNRASGTVATRNVDTDDWSKVGDSTLRVLPIAESTLTDWHEFWINIVADAGNSGGTGTHRVDIYLDGALTPWSTWVSASMAGNDYPSLLDGTPAQTIWRNYIGIGNCRASDTVSKYVAGAGVGTAAYDVDFFSWTPGIYVPVPEPMTAGLFALGGLLFVSRRRP
jgi:hypothetical protein